MGLGLGLGLQGGAGGGVVPGWALGTDLWRDFAHNIGTLPVPSDIHASPILADDRVGAYSSFGTNVPVRTDRGLQTVPTRTNSLRNSAMLGAATPNTLPTSWGISGALGGLVREVTGTGSERGLPYLDVRLHGVPNISSVYAIGFEAQSFVAAASGQTWTGSFFARMVAGSKTGFSSIQFRPARGYQAGGGTSGDASPQPDITADLDATFKRFTATSTLADVATAFIAPQVLFNYQDGVAVDITVRFQAPQLEQATFASVPFLTSGIAASLAGNLQAVALPSQLDDGVAGIIQFDRRATGAGDVIFSFNDGAGIDEHIRLVRDGAGELSFETRTGGGAYIPLVLGPDEAGLRTVAFASGPNYHRARLIGASEVAAMTTQAFPAGLARLGLGGTSLNATQNAFQSTRKLALKFGPQNEASFDEVYALAEAAT